MFHALITISLFCLAQDDPLSKLRELAKEEKGRPQARRVLVEGLQNEVNEAFDALKNRQLGQMETHLIRAATLAQPYSPQYAELLFRLLFSTRAEVVREGVALVRDCGSDARKRRDPSTRIKDAKTYSLLAPTYLDALDRLQKRCAEWLLQRPESEEIELEVARWQNLRPKETKKSNCSVCKGSRAIDCTGCETGLIAHTCRTCSGKKKVLCLLCLGKGRVEHAGYVGKIRFQITKSYTKKVFQRYKGSLLLRTHPQTLTWTLGACNGQGEFGLQTHSKPLNPQIPAAAPRNVQKECQDLWKDMDRHVLNGRAGLEAPGEKGTWEKLRRESVKSRFLEYKNCKNGRIPCDTCNGKKRVSCTSCHSRGSHLGPCRECRGTAVRLCISCQGVGDTSWILSVVPEVEGLSDFLKNHAATLALWIQERPKHAATFRKVTVEYAKQQRKVDSKAVFQEHAVTVSCKKCRGKKSTCTLCWGSGRIEYLEGTDAYTPYATLLRLKNQLATLYDLIRTPPNLGKLTLPEALARGEKAPRPKKSADNPFVDPPLPSKGGTKMEIKDLPVEIQVVLQNAQEQHKTGMHHLENAKSATEDGPRVKEEKEALRYFREAEASYTLAIKALENRNLGIPQELLEQVRVNLQVLVVTQKRSF